MTSFLKHQCCEDENGYPQCPDDPCGDCVKCNPMICVVLVSDAADDYLENLTHYDTYLATNPDGTQAYSLDGECLHIAVPRGSIPPSDTNQYTAVNDFQVLPTSAFTDGYDPFCNPDYCYEYPNDPTCYCTPEEEYKWNGQESVGWVFYYWDYYQGMHTTDSFQNGNMPWDDSYFCGYQLGGRSLYYFRDVGWTFSDYNSTVWGQWDGTIFTTGGNDPGSSSYYQIS